MPYIPTLIELFENVSNDLKNKLKISDDELKKVLDAFASVIAGQLKLSYLSLSDIQNNVLPDKANSSINGGTLDRFGMIQLNRLQRPATNGVYNISVDAEIGSVLRSGLTFKSNDNTLNPGKIFILDVEKITTENPQIVEVRSIDGGIDYLLQVNDQLTITEPVIGVNQVVFVSEIIEQPLASESEADYRKAIIDSIQLEPQGGSKTDYRLWASDAQGVRNSYSYVKDGEAGTIQVFVEATKIDSLDGYGTPTLSILNEVAEVIEFDPDVTRPTSERGRRPIQANIETLPIFVNPVDVTIIGLTDNNSEIQDLIRSNIDQYLSDIRPYVAGGDLTRNKNDILYAAGVQSVVSGVIDSANYFSDMILEINGVQQVSYLFSKENIPYLRNLNFG